MFKSAIAIAIITFTTLFSLNSADAQTPRLGLAGDIFSFSNGASTFRVNGVVPGSIAESMGVRVGDHVLKINGIKPRTQQHINMATISGNRRVVLRVRRGSKVAELTSGGQPSRPSSSPSFARSNFQQLKVKVARRPAGFLQITAVGRNGLGYEQGLRVGDIIVRIDGKLVTNVREFRQIVANASVMRMVVKTPGGSKRRVVIR